MEIIHENKINLLRCEIGIWLWVLAAFNRIIGSLIFFPSVIMWSIFRHIKLFFYYDVCMVIGIWSYGNQFPHSTLCTIKPITFDIYFVLHQICLLWLLPTNDLKKQKGGKTMLMPSATINWYNNKTSSWN